MLQNAAYRLFSVYTAYIRTKIPKTTKFKGTLLIKVLLQAIAISTTRYTILKRESCLSIDFIQVTLVCLPQN